MLIRVKYTELVCDRVKWESLYSFPAYLLFLIASLSMLEQKTILALYAPFYLCLLTTMLVYSEITLVVLIYTSMYYTRHPAPDR